METAVNREVDLLDRLERIETFDSDVDAARSTLVAALESADEEMHEEVYAALRGWTGRALRSSLSGADLRAWHGLLEGVAARMGEVEWRVRVDVLVELLYERAGMAENRTREAVTKRRHAPEILLLLASQPAGAIDRTALVDRLGLGQANLTRVCNLLADAGLVRRHVDGRNVRFEITATGLAAAYASPRVMASLPTSIVANDVGPWSVWEELRSPQVAATTTPSVSSWENADVGDEEFEYVWKEAA